MKNCENGGILRQRAAHASFRGSHSDGESVYYITGTHENFHCRFVYLHPQTGLGRSLTTLCSYTNIPSSVCIYYFASAERERKLKHKGEKKKFGLIMSTWRALSPLAFEGTSGSYTVCIRDKTLTLAVKAASCSSRDRIVRRTCPLMNQLEKLFDWNAHQSTPYNFTWWCRFWDRTWWGAH